MKSWRAYRVLCVALVVAWILPQYLWLLRRERLGGKDLDQARWDRVHRRCADAIHFLGVHLRGLFVKLCQIVGARRDVLPPVFGDRLGRFHDRVPPRPLSALQHFVEAQLGKPLAEAFAEIDAEPMAAASLAQVHRAQRSDGSTVAVKIQYPEIEEACRVDLRSLRAVGRIVALVQNRLDLRSVVEELARFFALEVDFTREAASTRRAAHDFEGSEDVRIPGVHGDLSGRKLLVLEFLEGVKITDLEALRARGHVPEEVAARVGRIYARMLFAHGFFHGDPHPGNLLVLPDGRIGLLDFGLAKELPAGFGAGVAEMLRCALLRDTPGALAAARSLGFEVRGDDGTGLQTFVGMLMGQPTTRHNLLAALDDSPVGKIPEHFGLVVRTLILLNGLSHTLAPNKRLIQMEMLRFIQRQLAVSASASGASGTA